VVHLEKPFRENIFRSMGSTMRKRIRHAKKCGAQVIIDEQFMFFDDFAHMHREMVKKFGMVTQKEDYDQILNIFKNKIKLFVCFVDKEPISAILCYYTPTTGYGPMAPYTHKAHDYSNNTLPFCAAIRDACEAGYIHFDMGITQTQTLASYKENFGARRIPMMVYQKKFSKIKMAANMTARSIVQCKKKMADLFRKEQ
jgi:lipid II:glycine glycyltransferase (peptidoglycan interpeptide bridge formation enzyme)